VANLIDTHAHLDDEQFHPDLPAVLERARQAGVSSIVAVGITANSSERCCALGRQYPDVLATVGIHPNEIMQAQEGDWDRIIALVKHEGVTGIGETGLDRYWDKTPFAIQEEWFARHLELGWAHNLPVVIHCRDAEADVVRMLRERFDRHGPILGVMHSFVGTEATAEACLAMGLDLSFAGMLTYKNAGSVRDVAAKVPIDRVLVETDCPYLAPVPYRGKRNEPANVVHTATCLAQVRNQPLDEISEQTSVNARRLFRLSR
jgi:TatD DNase family protein